MTNIKTTVQALTDELQRVLSQRLLAWNGDVERSSLDDAIDAGRALLAQLEGEAAEPVGEIKIEGDYWSRGHFYEGSRKAFYPNAKLQDLPVGTKLYATAQPISQQQPEPVHSIEQPDSVDPVSSLRVSVSAGPDRALDDEVLSLLQRARLYASMRPVQSNADEFATFRRELEAALDAASRGALAGGQPSNEKNPESVSTPKALTDEDEHKAFQAWASDQWKGRNIPDNAWLGWKARAILERAKQ